MAKVLPNYNRTTKPGPVPTYPWAKWFDGKTRRLTQGEDFACTITALQDHVRKTARAYCPTCKVAFPKRNLVACRHCSGPLGVSISVYREENGIVIQPR